MPLRKVRAGSIGVLPVPDENRHPSDCHYRLKDWAGRFAGNDIVQNGLPKKKDGRPDIPHKINSALVRAAGTHTNQWQTIVWRIF